MSAASLFLLLETVFVTVAVVWLIRFLRSNPIARGAWPTVPLVLLSAALIPTLLRKRNLGQIGLNTEQFGLSLRVLCGTCLVVFPLLFCGVLLLKHYQIPLPLCPVLPEKRWLSWLFYQFMYVAVAEEVFFRGYLLSNISCLLTTTTKKSVALSQLMSIIISAGYAC